MSPARQFGARARTAPSVAARRTRFNARWMWVHGVRVRTGAAALLAVGTPAPLGGQQGGIPLCTGLTIVTAIDRPEGDYESIKTVVDVGERGITLSYSAQVPTDRGSLRNWKMRRTVLREDLGTATLYAHHFNSKGPQTIAGSTALGASTAVLRSLKRAGAAELGLIPAGSTGYPADRAQRPNVYEFEETWKLRRVGTGTLPVRITVNDTVVTLPAIQARGSYIGEKVEFLFLDDEDNPLALQYGFASGGEEDGESRRLRVVKISYRCAGPTRSASDERIARLERALREQRRAVVYDLYFDFNSDVMREESEPTLREIAEVLRRNPDWILSIEGHTDDVASDRYNLELSGRRAAAVKAALGAQFSIAGTRLTTAGFGESRPQDRNDTVEGRARNRRVELVRR
jgi:outer membrane protein OmpA-like peptidoglycan-associated protein